PQPVPGALDLDAADGRPAELGVEVLADADVLGEVVRVLAVREPARLPVGDDPEAEPVRVDLLPHPYSPSSSAAGAASASGAPSSSAAGASSSTASTTGASASGGCSSTAAPVV